MKGGRNVGRRAYAELRHDLDARLTRNVLCDQPFEFSPHPVLGYAKPSFRQYAPGNTLMRMRGMAKGKYAVVRMPGAKLKYRPTKKRGRGYTKKRNKR